MAMSIKGVIKIFAVLSAIQMYLQIQVAEAYTEFGSGNEQQAKQEIGSKFIEISELGLWIGFGLSIVGFIYGLAQQNGFVGNADNGAKTAKQALVVGAICGVGQAIIALYVGLVG